MTQTEGETKPPQCLTFDHIPDAGKMMKSEVGDEKDFDTFRGAVPRHSARRSERLVVDQAL